jgi:hypothetical protein
MNFVGRTDLTVDQPEPVMQKMLIKAKSRAPWSVSVRR